MMYGVMTREDIQRERVVEWAKTQCQSVLLRSMEGGFTSNLSYIVDVNDISTHILPGDINNNNNNSSNNNNNNNNNNNYYKNPIC